MSRRLHPIIKELLLDDYKYQGVYSTTPALFDINEVLLALGEQTDPEYRPGMVAGPDPESTAGNLLDAVLHRNGWDDPSEYSLTIEDLRTSYSVILRYDELLRANGQEL